MIAMTFICPYFLMHLATRESAVGKYTIAEENTADIADIYTDKTGD